MEKIYFDESTFIWKTKLNLVNLKKEIINEAFYVIDSLPNVKTDGFGYKTETTNLDFVGDITIENNLDKIVQSGINLCKELYTETNIPFNKINTDSWVNVVRSIDPVQIQFKHDELKGVDKFHVHTDINKLIESFVPHYTYVYYIQMPDVMEGEDGVLYFRGQNKKEYWIRPEEDDLIIMPADMPHTPNNAPKSTIDRIVLAGNVGFEFIKKQKSLI
jgi:cupin superfamily acireductone dioxygenase involved in methionine salvage